MVMPEYEEVATQLKEEGSEIRLAKIDITKEREFVSKFKLKRVPTLIFFKKNKQITCDHSRTSDAIMGWLKQKMAGPVQLNGEEQTGNFLLSKRDFLKNKKVAVLGYFKTLMTKEAQAFRDAADMIDDVPFAVLYSDEFPEPRIVLHKAFDERHAVYNGTYTDEQIIKFVNTEKYELVAKYCVEDPAVFQGDVKQFLVIFINESTIEIESILPSLRKTAKAFKGRLRVIYADIAGSENDEEFQFLMMEKKVQMQDLPLAVRLFNRDNQRLIYRYETQKISEKDLHDFVQNFFDEKLKPYFQSQDIPEDWNKHPVKVLVGKNFHEVVNGKNKHVFAAFHASWSPDFNESLAQNWTKLAENFKDNTEVIIAKFDSSQNEIEDMELMHTLEVKWFAKDGKVINYWGSKRFEALAKFVESRGQIIEGRWDEEWGTRKKDKEQNSVETDGNQKSSDSRNEQAAQEEVVGNKLESVKRDEF